MERTVPLRRLPPARGCADGGLLLLQRRRPAGHRRRADRDARRPGGGCTDDPGPSGVSRTERVSERVDAEGLDQLPALALALIDILGARLEFLRLARLGRPLPAP